jgi:menaquinone-9 beta-reductase
LQKTTDIANEQTYDVAIIGGGLAGLALSIQCAREGLHTALFEKEKYPFHRVCGEYISFESWNFLQELGLPLSDMQLPQINRLLVSAPNGSTITESLIPGGFGISRYRIDYELYQIAKQEGVEVHESTRVMDVVYARNNFNIFTNRNECSARIVAGAFGKRSNLDIRWKRNFIRQRPGNLNHYIGVKYHIEFDHPKDVIALHNFHYGYCGISAIENGLNCLCYLTNASNLRKNMNDIHAMEDNVLKKNPFLKNIWENSNFIYKEPLTISQVSLQIKSQVENHILMIGDAAGLITPLCGNGMSIALHSSKIAFEEIMNFVAQKNSRFEMEQQYAYRWEKNFSRRMQTGRIIQRFFGSEMATTSMLAFLKPFPSITKYLIRQTHGNTF